MEQKMEHLEKKRKFKENLNFCKSLVTKGL